jgi:hypothetical protein
MPKRWVLGLLGDGPARVTRLPYYHLLIHFFLAGFQGKSFLTPYPQWVLIVGGLLATLSVLPIPVVFLLRRFQFLRLDTDINKGVIRRNETTISTKQMMTDVDVSFFLK